MSQDPSGSFPPSIQASKYQPLPFKQAIQQLPAQYARVLLKPSAGVFAQEMRKAAWDITLVSLVVYTFIYALVDCIEALYVYPQVEAELVRQGTVSALIILNILNAPLTYVLATVVSQVLFDIPLTPIEFFIFAGVTFWFARMFKGKGDFLGQCYTLLLWMVPLFLLREVVGSLLFLLPQVGGILGLAVWALVDTAAIVWFVLQMKAAHGLSTGAALGTVFVPGCIFSALIFCGVIALALLLAGG